MVYTGTKVLEKANPAGRDSKNATHCCQPAWVKNPPTLAVSQVPTSSGVVPSASLKVFGPKSLNGGDFSLIPGQDWDGKWTPNFSDPQYIGGSNFFYVIVC